MIFFSQQPIYAYLQLGRSRAFSLHLHHHCPSLLSLPPLTQSSLFATPTILDTHAILHTVGFSRQRPQTSTRRASPASPTMAETRDSKAYKYRQEISQVRISCFFRLLLAVSPGLLGFTGASGIPTLASTTFSWRPDPHIFTTLRPCSTRPISRLQPAGKPRVTRLKTNTLSSTVRPTLPNLLLHLHCTSSSP